MHVAHGSTTVYRELAHRTSGDLEIMLFWNSETDELIAAVSDMTSGSYFEIPADPACALDVFEHPFAYAAAKGIPYETELLASWAHVADQPDSAGAASRLMW